MINKFSDLLSITRSVNKIKLVNLPKIIVKNLSVEIKGVGAVYFFFDKNDALIYIGKTNNLKSRMSSHKFCCYNEWGSECLKITTHMRYFECDDEVLRLKYEGVFILKYQPKYNIHGKISLIYSAEKMFEKTKKTKPKNSAVLVRHTIRMAQPDTHETE